MGALGAIHFTKKRYFIFDMLEMAEETEWENNLGNPICSAFFSIINLLTGEQLCFKIYRTITISKVTGMCVSPHHHKHSRAVLCLVLSGSGLSKLTSQ